MVQGVNIESQLENHGKLWVNGDKEYVESALACKHVE